MSEIKRDYSLIAMTHLEIAKMKRIAMELKTPFDWHFGMEKSENICFAMVAILEYAGQPTAHLFIYLPLYPLR